MRDLPRCCENLFKAEPWAAVDQLNFALESLWADDVRSIHDKVADDMDFEELLGILMSAKERIQELESVRASLEEDVARFESGHYPVRA